MTVRRATRILLLGSAVWLLAPTAHGQVPIPALPPSLPDVRPGTPSDPAAPIGPVPTRAPAAPSRPTVAPPTALTDPAPAPPDPRLGSRIAPARGSLLGAYSWRRAGRTYAEERSYLERRLGRSFDAYRWWLALDDVPDATWLRDLFGSRTPVIAYNAHLEHTPGRRWAPWRDIAAGRYDAQVIRAARALARLRQPVLLVLHHEPEDDAHYGSPADYRLMFQRVSTLMRAYAPNVEVGWVLMAYTFAAADADAWWPGPEFVDWIGADGYNWHLRDRTWRGCGQIFNGFYAWATRDERGLPRNKPLLFAEYGTHDDPAWAQRSSIWLDDCRRWIKQRPEVKLTSYFHVGSWVLDDNGAHALGGMRAWGRDPYFRQR